MPRGLPLWKPPYSRMTAIDMNTGEHAWMSPLGNGERIRNHPMLRDLDLPPLGGDWARTGPLLTTTLLIQALVAGGIDGGPRLVAYDKTTGEEGGLARPARRCAWCPDDVYAGPPPVHRVDRRRRSARFDCADAPRVATAPHQVESTSSAVPGSGHSSAARVAARHSGASRTGRRSVYWWTATANTAVVRRFSNQNSSGSSRTRRNSGTTTTLGRLPR